MTTPFWRIGVTGPSKPGLRSFSLRATSSAGVSLAFPLPAAGGARHHLERAAGRHGNFLDDLAVLVLDANDDLGQQGAADEHQRHRHGGPEPAAWRRGPRREALVRFLRRGLWRVRECQVTLDLSDLFDHRLGGGRPAGGVFRQQPHDQVGQGRRQSGVQVADAAGFLGRHGNQRGQGIAALERPAPVHNR